MTISYRLLQPQDAELLVHAIDRVYGTTYPMTDFYDPAYIREALRNGSLHSIVALNESRQVVACMSTVLENAGDVTADGSALMVAPDYRGLGIVARLGQHSVQIYQQLELAGLHLYALALHDLVQNQSGAAGAVVTGVLPAWFAQSARVAGYPYPDTRIGAVTLYMPLGELPHRCVYIPLRYATVLSRIYERLDVPREFLEAPTQPVGEGAAAFTLESKPNNGQLRIVVERCGGNFGTALLDALVATSAKRAAVIYLDIPLNDEASSSATDYAAANGFFFGALLIDRQATDRLRLQRFDESLASPEDMVVATEDARNLLEFVQCDRRSVTS